MREFSINDVSIYPIALSWSASASANKNEPSAEMEVEGEEKKGGSSTVVFQKFNPVPNTKMLTFYRKDTFSLTAT